MYVFNLTVQLNRAIQTRQFVCTNAINKTT